MNKSVELRCTNRRLLPFSSESAQAKYKIYLLDTLASAHYKVRRFTDKVDFSKQKLNTESTLFCGKEFALRY